MISKKCADNWNQSSGNNAGRQQSEQYKMKEKKQADWVLPFHNDSGKTCEILCTQTITYDKSLGYNKVYT